MWRCVDLELTDVSEERIAPILRVEKSASGEPAWFQIHQRPYKKNISSGSTPAEQQI
jgi:hypothetical protein